MKSTRVKMTSFTGSISLSPMPASNSVSAPLSTWYYDEGNDVEDQNETSGTDLERESTRQTNLDKNRKKSRSGDTLYRYLTRMYSVSSARQSNKENESESPISEADSPLQIVQMTFNQSMIGRPSALEESKSEHSIQSVSNE